MKKLITLVISVAMVVMVSGCAGTIPTDSYAPQNFVRYDHSKNVEMGAFAYTAMNDPKLKLKPNQIQNTALGSIYISSNVADMVKRATAMELEKTGFKLTDQSSIAIGGDILELKADDLGYSVHWTYSIMYRIVDNESGGALYQQTYTPPMKKTGKFGLPSDFAPIIHEVILNGYDMFIRDQRVRDLLDKEDNSVASVPKVPSSVQ